MVDSQYDELAAQLEAMMKRNAERAAKFESHLQQQQVIIHQTHKISDLQQKINSSQPDDDFDDIFAAHQQKAQSAWQEHTDRVV